ncbi:hypothetical protein CC86DRAFT_437077 [Ophiobolus disseminans]|uniref:Uncharacterized protein n=1 Tax=Ophiobolus disseminans TaxID=1469910 RepID=A0A6A7A9M5_9PLEO|nr:hypothetical protein CC86DRAFT_437077 [Ophiobolus disseminans]
MPFLIRPPLNSAAAEEHSLILTLIEPDKNDCSMLRDLRDWGWRISRHDFHDEEFIEALTQSERNAKQRRRHTRTVGNELYGYVEKPTLEDIWMEEAPDRFLEELDDEEMKERTGAGTAKKDAEDEAEMYCREWLRHIDRTLQTNGYLDYVDGERDRPRLVTRGLDHSDAVSTRVPARIHYFDDDSRQSTAHIYSDGQRRKSFRNCFRKPVTILSRRTEPTRNRDSIVVTTDISMSPVADLPPVLQEPETSHTRQYQCLVLTSKALPPPPPSSRLHRSYSSPDIALIFPGTHTSTRSYIEQTQPGIHRAPPTNATAPSLHRAGLSADPYGWQVSFSERPNPSSTQPKKNYRVAPPVPRPGLGRLAWVWRGSWDAHKRAHDAAKIKTETSNAKESVKFFVGRERRSLNDRAREKLGIDAVGGEGRKAREFEGRRLNELVKGRSEVERVGEREDHEVVTREVEGMAKGREEESVKKDNTLSALRTWSMMGLY